MADASFRILGRVIDRRTRRGIGGLRIEAWDLDTRFHDLVGQATTDPQGHFTIAFDETYFGEQDPDHQPDIFFNIFLGGRQIHSTRDAPLENVRPTDVEVTLEVDMPGEEPAGEDRVSLARAIMGVEFLRQSDFGGIRRDVGDKVKAFGGLLGDLVKTSLEELDLQPLHPPEVRTGDVIGQDAVTAQRNLGAHGVVVNEIREYRPGDPQGALRGATSLPRILRPGDRVDLYQENGQVRAYAAVREKRAADVHAEDVVRLDGEVAAMRSDLSEVPAVRAEVGQVRAAADEGRAQLAAEVEAVKTRVTELDAVRTELKVVRQQAAEKDQMIAALQRDLATVRSSQEQMATAASPERIARIELALRRLEEGRTDRPPPAPPSRGRKNPPR